MSPNPGYPRSLWMWVTGPAGLDGPDRPGQARRVPPVPCLGFWAMAARSQMGMLGWAKPPIPCHTTHARWTDKWQGCPTVPSLEPPKSNLRGIERDRISAQVAGFHKRVVHQLLISSISGLPHPHPHPLTNVLWHLSTNNHLPTPVINNEQP